MFATSFLASCLTKNQIFAFLLGVLFNFILIIIGTPIVTLSFPPIIGAILRGMSYVGHIESFSQGMLSLTDSVYFLSVIAVALSFSHAHLARFQRTGSLNLSLKSMTQPLSLL
jgi:ABC-2 type transport system permease protein